ncbi:MAG: hypothetical protein V8R40_03205 [Dysosmobacter sp.]
MPWTTTRRSPASSGCTMPTSMVPNANLAAFFALVQPGDTPSWAQPGPRRPSATQLPTFRHPCGHGLNERID